jgi:H+-transporting ATPase
VTAAGVDSKPDAGLSSEEAARRLSQYGANETPEAREHPWRSVLAKLWAPVPWMLEATIILEAALGKTTEALIVAALLGFNVVVSFIQENRANTALTLLRSRLTVRARVLRDGLWQQVEARELVPGDVVHLRMGDVVPADVQLSTGQLQVDQSSLTGESLPAELAGGDRAYAGSVIERGEATGQVIATGASTFYGRTAELVRTAAAKSHLETAIVRIVRNLVALDFALALVVIAFSLHRSGVRPEILQFAVVLLLASVPVALPATFALASALGARELARQGILTTHLSAIEEAAGMDVLCTDKTGTITLNQLAVSDLHPYPPYDQRMLVALASHASDEATQDPLDLAILRKAKELGSQPGVERLSFTPFDPATKRSEAVIRDGAGQLRVLKGAPSELAHLCAATPASLDADLEVLANKGERVLAVASGADSRLELVGLVGLADPPRPDSRGLVRDLQTEGVRVIMITGDALPTARAVAREIGLSGNVCEAASIRDGVLAPDCAVMAGVLPEDKYRLVKALQAQDHVVGMTGDGVNDAPALKQADVGIAVSSATDVAKAAAALVLTESGLPGVLTAVQLSRRTYQRMLTYALNASAKKIEMPIFLSVVFLATGLFALTPILMVLLLVANDFSTMTITTDRVVASSRPDRWRVNQLLLGASAVAFPFLLLSLTIFFLARTWLGLDLAHLQTVAFVTLAFSTQATVYLVREPRLAWRSRPGSWLLAVSGLVLVTVSVLALGGWLMTSISAALLGTILAAVILWALAVDLLKVVAFRRLGLHRLA